MFPGARRKAYFIAAPKPKTYGLSLFQETPPEDFIFANIMYPASRAFIRYVAERIAAAVYRWFCPGRNINHRGDDCDFRPRTRIDYGVIASGIIRYAFIFKSAAELTGQCSS
jgi:hypothetical protein